MPDDRGNEVVQNEVGETQPNVSLGSDIPEHLASLIEAGVEARQNRREPRIADRENGIRYADIYPGIPEEQILETHALCKVFWKLAKAGALEHQQAAVRRWLEAMGTLVGIQPPDFFFVDDPMLHKMTGGGQYSPATHKIYSYGKMSLVTLLHEFRHAMQAKREGLNMYRENMEEDARAWSMSLFRLASPRMYDNAVEKGIVYFA